MALVIEKGMLRNVIDLHPWSGFPVIEIPVLLLDLGVFGNNVFMAVETLFHRRKSWISRVAHVRVAELTLNLFDAGMDPMAERDRLLGTDVRCRRNVKIVKKNHYEEEAGAYEKKLAPVIRYEAEKVFEVGGEFHLDLPRSGGHEFGETFQGEGHCQSHKT